MRRTAREVCVMKSTVRRVAQRCTVTCERMRIEYSRRSIQYFVISINHTQQTSSAWDAGVPGEGSYVDKNTRRRRHARLSPHLVFDIGVCAAVDKRAYQRQVAARRRRVQPCRRNDLMQGRATHLRRHTHRQTDVQIKQWAASFADIQVQRHVEYSPKITARFDNFQNL